MIEVVDFQPHHARLIVPQAAQRVEFDAAPPISGEAVTLIRDGLPLACAGLVPLWAGRAYAWALLDQDAGPHLLAVTRAIRSRLDRSAWRRIEMAVAVDFPAGERWARLLGFGLECRARAYFPDGGDALIFVRV